MSRDLTSSQAEVVETVQGPLLKLSETANSMLALLYIKAETEADYLFVQTLRDKFLQDYFSVVQNLMSIVDPSFDLNDHITKVKNDFSNLEMECPYKRKDKKGFFSCFH